MYTEHNGDLKTRPAHRVFADVNFKDSLMNLKLSFFKTIFPLGKVLLKEIIF